MIALCPPQGPYCRLVERALFFPRPETRLAYSLPVKRLKPVAILDRRQNGYGIKQEVLCDKMPRGAISASRAGMERRSSLPAGRLQREGGGLDQISSTPWRADRSRDVCKASAWRAYRRLFPRLRLRRLHRPWPPPANDRRSRVSSHCPQSSGLKLFRQAQIRRQPPRARPNSPRLRRPGSKPNPLKYPIYR